MRSIELFSGCGGLALGTARAGFHHECLVEWTPYACATLAQNKTNATIPHVRDWTVINSDVRTIHWPDILGGDIDLVAGGPPCQPFSFGGKHKGNDDARDMWPEAIRAVRELLPRAFLFENVRGLARPAFANYLAWITASLSTPSLSRRNGEPHATHLTRLQSSTTPDPAASYDTIVLKVNAADFGTAQKRHRVVIAGLRRDLGLPHFSRPTPSHSRERLLWDQWISGDYWTRHDMRPPTASPTSESDIRTVRQLRSTGQQPDTVAWRTIRDALAGLGEPTGLNNHTSQDGAKTYPGHTGSPLDQPAKALKAGDHGVPGGENMMVRDDNSVRYFTVREAARLQGMPDEWSFSSSWSESMRQIGNAVPVNLAETLGRWLHATLN